MAQRTWTCTFSPDLPRRSYMMDVDPSDGLEVPDIAAALGPFGGVDPLTLVQTRDWEAVPAGDRAVRVGTVLESLLTIAGDIDPFGRTPCREEHVIIVAVLGEADRDPVVFCPIVTWSDLSGHRRELQSERALERARRGQQRGLLPALFPCPGYDVEPNAFVWVARQEATLRRHVASKMGTPAAPIRLRREPASRLQAAVMRPAGRS